MELSKLILAIVVLILSTCVIRGAVKIGVASDFQRAREEITKYAQDSIKYDDTLCGMVGEGEDKIACRLKNVPSVGFLVCQKPEIDDALCRGIIENEVSNLVKLQVVYKIKTVEVDKLPVHNVKCGKTDDVTCSGFLEEWIDDNKGKFAHIGDTIYKGSYKNVSFILTVDILLWTAFNYCCV
jgi:hypothetical protein